jgi:hypothetical protein
MLPQDFLLTLVRYIFSTSFRHSSSYGLLCLISTPRQLRPCWAALSGLLDCISALSVPTPSLVSSGEVGPAAVYANGEVVRARTCGVFCTFEDLLLLVPTRRSPNSLLCDSRVRLMPIRLA